MDKHPGSLLVGSVFVVIIGLHWWMLTSMNRRVSAADAKQRSINTIFTIWHGVGVIVLLVASLLIERDDTGLRWVLLPFGANLFIAIYWWRNSLSRLRNSTENADNLETTQSDVSD